MKQWEIQCVLVESKDLNFKWPGPFFWSPQWHFALLRSQLLRDWQAARCLLVPEPPSEQLYLLGQLQLVPWPAYCPARCPWLPLQPPSSLFFALTPLLLWDHTAGLIFIYFISLFHARKLPRCSSALLTAYCAATETSPQLCSPSLACLLACLCPCAAGLRHYWPIFVSTSKVLYLLVSSHKYFCSICILSAPSAIHSCSIELSAM